MGFQACSLCYDMPSLLEQLKIFFPSGVLRIHLDQADSLISVMDIDNTVHAAHEHHHSSDPSACLIYQYFLNLVRN